MNACIRNVIDQLPENYRTVIVLSELEGLSDQDMAEVLGLSLEAAKIRLHRARTRLKEDLSRHCIFYRTEQNELACDRKGPFPIYNENDKKKSLVILPLERQGPGTFPHHPSWSASYEYSIDSD